MCPLWPLHFIFLYVLLLGPLWLIFCGVVGAAAHAMSPINIFFNPQNVSRLKEGKTETVEISIDYSMKDGDITPNSSLQVVYLEILVDDGTIAKVSPDRFPLENIDSKENSSFVFNVTGEFLGITNVCAQIEGLIDEHKQCIPVSVTRETGPLDKAFTYSVAALVTIIYINMGAALDLPTIKETIRRPYGPGIGLFSQFVVMPLLSYGLAKLLIPIAALQLGLFITGCSPGGGASNIWTLTLGGNLNLSITMTTISTFSAFVMMPLWILTLGSTIFAEAKLAIPYSKIATFAIALVVPLAIGIGIQFLWPRLAKFLVKILKPFAVFLIVFIVVFAVYTNLYLLQLLTWEILLSGMLLPWLGYLIGGSLAHVLKRDWKDVVAIAIETGVQNTGLSIFALRTCLEQPEADLTTVMPVAVAIMTPVVPTLIFICQKVRGRRISEMTAEPKREDSMTPALNPSA